MGEVVPGECVTNALPEEDPLGMSSGCQCMWDALQGFLAGELATEGEVATAEPLLEEKGKEEDQSRGSSMAGGLAPLEAP